MQLRLIQKPLIHYCFHDRFLTPSETDPSCWVSSHCVHSGVRLQAATPHATQDAGWVQMLKERPTGPSGIIQMNQLDSLPTQRPSFFLSDLSLMTQSVPRPMSSGPIMQLENNQPPSSSKGPAQKPFEFLPFQAGFSKRPKQMLFCSPSFTQCPLLFFNPNYISLWNLGCLCQEARAMVQ